jgi:hypothetical protein
LGKARSLPYGRLLALAICIRLDRKRFASDKHSSILQTLVNYTRKFICRIDPKNAFPKPAFGGFKVENPEFGWKERKVEYMTRRQKEKEKEVVERLRIQRCVHCSFNLGPIL